MATVALVLGLAKQHKKSRKLVVSKSNLTVKFWGVAELIGVPPNAPLRVKVRVSTAKSSLTMPYVDRPALFVAQKVSLTTFNAADEVVHIFVQYSSKLK